MRESKVTRQLRLLQGTLLRTACALGWQAAYLLPGCCDVYNDKALRAGRGAAFKLPLARGSWEDLQAVLEAHGLTALAAHPRENPYGGAPALSRS